MSMKAVVPKVILTISMASLAICIRSSVPDSPRPLSISMVTPFFRGFTVLPGTGISKTPSNAFTAIFSSLLEWSRSDPHRNP